MHELLFTIGCFVNSKPGFLFMIWGFVNRKMNLLFNFYCDTDSIGITESSEEASDTLMKRFIKGIFM